jgi:hypothetical protein
MGGNRLADILKRKGEIFPLVFKMDCTVFLVKFSKHLWHYQSPPSFWQRGIHSDLK